MATTVTATATAAPPALGLVSNITPAPQPPPGQPDISYHPDWDKYQARVARRTQTENLPKTLPEGFPKEIKGDLVWEGETVAQTYNWTYVFSADQLAEIDNAVTHFKCKALATPIPFVWRISTCCNWLTNRPNSPEARLWLHNARDVSASYSACRAAPSLS